MKGEIRVFSMAGAGSDEKGRQVQQEHVNLSPVEIRELMDAMRPTTKHKVLIVGEERLPALQALMGEVAKGVAVRYHGEILGNMSVFSSTNFPSKVFKVAEIEELTRWLSRMQLPLEG